MKTLFSYFPIFLFSLVIISSCTQSEVVDASVLDDPALHTRSGCDGEEGFLIVSAHITSINPCCLTITLKPGFENYEVELVLWPDYFSRSIVEDNKVTFCKAEGFGNGTYSIQIRNPNASFPHGVLACDFFDITGSPC